MIGENNQKETPSAWAWCQVAEAPFVACSGVAVPTAATEPPEHTPVCLCVLELTAASHRSIFICFHVQQGSAEGRAGTAGVSRGCAGCVQQLPQSVLTLLTCQCCDSRCDVVFQGMISGELQVVWEACP